MKAETVLSVTRNRGQFEITEKVSHGRLLGSSY